MKKFYNLLKKYYLKYEEVINYLIIGGLTTFVSLFIYYGCTFTFLNPNNPIELQVANVISWICAVTFAYFANRIFVFKSKNEKKIQEAVKFYSGRIATLILEMLIMYILVSLLHFNDRICKIIAQLIIIVVNYLISKLIVFKK